jgi:glycerol-1-phosphate dehydrogenase [NAD(P)+]
MKTDLPVYIEDDVIPSLLEYCARNALSRFYLVADDNTYEALGRRVEETLTGRGLDVKAVMVRGEEIIADERYIVQVLAQVGREERMYLAVGSGTLTDIVRFVSHRTRTAFLSLPTAPSVDGYSSGGAPLVIGRLKQTVYTHAPLAIFADLNTLRAAPRAMIASGFGDMVGKYTSSADWKLGRLLWDEPYSAEIIARVWQALEACARSADQIGARSAEGIRNLMDGLVESGLCMLDFGLSHPASASEHYLSHFWEMKLLSENRPAILHGQKVGVASILVARFYEQVRRLSRDQAGERLAATPMPERDQEIERIRRGYPVIADNVIAEQRPFLELSPEGYRALQRKILDQWDAIQEIAASVPSAGEMADLLRRVGGPVDTRTLGLNDEEVALGLEYAHYYRNRFSVIKLSRMLGIPLVTR